MKVTSAILTTMSGKLGGAVASTARGGIQYFRKLIVPRNPRSFLQTAIRNAVTSASAYWKSTMSEVQMDQWWDVAEGSQTGKSLFSRVNQPRFYATNTDRIVSGDATVGPSIDVLTVPPPSFSTVIGPVTAVIDDSANTLVVSDIPTGDAWFDSDNQGAGTPAVLYVFVSRGQAPSRFSRQHPYELVAAIAWSGGLTPVTTKTIDLAALGITSTEGRVMYVKTYAQSPLGGTSTPVEQRITVVA